MPPGAAGRHGGQRPSVADKRLPRACDTTATNQIQTDLLCLPAPAAPARDCVRALRPRRLVPTVGAVGEPAKARAIIDRFADLMDLSRDRSRLDCYLARPPKTASERQGGASPPGSQGGAAAAAAGGSQEGDPPEAQRQGGVPPADSSGAGGEAWSPADAAGASGSCEVGGPQHSAAAAAGPAGPAPLPAQQEQQQQQQASEADVDLAAIDVREQQRILSHIQWEQRSAAISSAASQGSPKSGGGSSSSRRSGACSGGKKRGPAAGGGDSRTAGLQQPSVKRFFQPTQGSPT